MFAELSITWEVGYALGNVEKADEVLLWCYR